jgi:CheY-like chemotaxis protein
MEFDYPFGFVMVIDDGAIERLIADKVIARSGFAKIVVSLSSAEEALQYLNTEKLPHPELIFVDLNMPLVNGFEFIQEYERKFGSNNNTRIIILSSSDSPYDVQEAEKYNSVCSYLTKPVSPEKLRKVLMSSKREKG